jgi:hypothetical protein
MTHLLKDHGNFGIAGWFGFDKSGLEGLVAAIEVDALKGDDVKMKIGV